MIDMSIKQIDRYECKGYTDMYNSVNYQQLSIQLHFSTIIAELFMAVAVFNSAGKRGRLFLFPDHQYSVTQTVTTGIPSLR